MLENMFPQKPQFLAGLAGLELLSSVADSIPGLTLTVAGLGVIDPESSLRLGVDGAV